jgi:hypothetical protein
MSLPAVVNCVIYRGDSWSQSYRFVIGGIPIDLSGATVAAQARSASGILYDLQVAVDPTTFVVTMTLPPDSLPVEIYDYDIEVNQSGEIKTWVRGKLTVNRDVTNELP